MTTSIYWFRNDLRLTDHVALRDACAASDELLLVYVISTDETRETRWGFPRWGDRRRRFRDQALTGLRNEVAKKGNRLLILNGRPAEVIPVLVEQTGADRVFCEMIPAPEEIAEVAALREAGVIVCDRWHSSLLDPADLPFGIDQLPEVFTDFRHAVERARVLPHPPLAAPPKLPPTTPLTTLRIGSTEQRQEPLEPEWFLFSDPAFDGSEITALAHVARYFASDAPQSYKTTRNRLTGINYSTKFSPWLAVGALSPRTIFQSLKSHEALFGATDSTYWIWFELLWRDFFRFWSRKHGARLFRARGLSSRPPMGHDPRTFSLWCAGQTGHAFVDAGLRELAATGYLSNRMRQVVASYLVHDMACDWRAGAAWFESSLVDFDICSNQGNWLYLAGLGADPRGGRRFNPDSQAMQHDSDGAYRASWAVGGEGPE